MPVPVRFDGAAVDLSSRIFESHAVAASPSAATETTICTLTIGTDLSVQKGVLLEAIAAFTVGTSGVSANLKIRQTNTSGTTIWATGATTVVAGNLYSLGGQGIDTAQTLPGQVYVVTLTIGSGAATSTVSAVSLFATVI